VCRNELGTEIEVKYELVEDIRNTHVRFAAYYRNRDERCAQMEWKPLSALHWASLLSFNNYRSSELANELTLVIVNTCPYDAFFFETKGVSSKNASEKQFEFILVNSNSLKKASANPDRSSFEEHLNSKKCKMTTACSFWNLSGSSKLIAPRQQSGKPLKTYSHLALFLRGASEKERVQMWGLVGYEYLNIMKEWKDKTVWLSTAGLGVSWLHFRLDNRPKYYKYTNFAREK